MDIKVFISFWSAARLWNIPFLYQAFASYLTGRMEYTVFNSGDRFSGPDVKVHLCTAKLPDNAVTILNGKPIVSPAYLFVQLCSELKINQAILLGCMMCSRIDGKPPLTNVAELREFASSLRYVPGAPRALDALTYVRENFYSYMEIMTYMKLDLPNRLGGFGAPGNPIINGTIEITDDERRYLGQKECYLRPDFLYEEHKVIIEYYGQEHSEKLQKIRDTRREKILREKGYKVVVIRKEDLYNLKKFEKLLRLLANFFMKRIRIRCPLYKEKFEKTRDLLPREIPDNSVYDIALEKFRSEELQWFFVAMRILERER